MPGPAAACLLQGVLVLARPPPDQLPELARRVGSAEVPHRRAALGHPLRICSGARMTAVDQHQDPRIDRMRRGAHVGHDPRRLLQRRDLSAAAEVDDDPVHPRCGHGARLVGVNR